MLHLVQDHRRASVLLSQKSSADEGFVGFYFVLTSGKTGERMELTIFSVQRGAIDHDCLWATLSHPRVSLLSCHFPAGCLVRLRVEAKAGLFH